MSDEPQPARETPPKPAYDPDATIPPTPKPLPPSPHPATAPGLPGAPGVPRPPGPPIDFAMRAPKKPFTIPAYTGCLVKMVFGFAVLLVMGYCALIALNPKAQKWASKGAKDGTGGPTPFKAMNQILAIPAQAIGKTKDVVAASDARTGIVNNVVAEEEAKQKGKTGGSATSAVAVTDPFAPAAKTAGAGKAAAPAPGDGPATISREALLAMAEQQAAAAADHPAPTPLVREQPKAPPGPPFVKLGGGITITNSSPEGAPPATQPFVFWVVGLNITGVNPPRLLLNNRLVYEGQEVNRSLGITFERFDVTKKLLVFRDTTGAVVTRSY